MVITLLETALNYFVVYTYSTVGLFARIFSPPSRPVTSQSPTLYRLRPPGHVTSGGQSGTPNRTDGRTGEEPSPGKPPQVKRVRGLLVG